MILTAMQILPLYIPWAQGLTYTLHLIAFSNYPDPEIIAFPLSKSLFKVPSLLDCEHLKK